MSFVIRFTHSYTKRAGKFLRKHPDLLGQYEKTLRLLELNPFHPSLRLHRLKGNLADLHSVSVNISYRVTLELLIEKEIIIPVNIGTHDDVYES
ncbi:MAG: plasmid stabilization protein [bacterium]